MTFNWMLVNIKVVMENLEANADASIGEKSLYETSGLVDWDKYYKFTHMYAAGSSEIFKTREFIDQPVMYEQHVRKGNVVEQNVWFDKYYRRNDVPDIKAFYDQGTTDRMSEWMDGSEVYYTPEDGEILISSGKTPVGIMNDRDFRERCVVVEGKLQALQDNSTYKVVHKPEWLMEELDISYEDALTLCAAWTKLGIRRQDVRRLMYGYFDGNEWKSGLSKISKNRCKFYAEFFEDLVNKMDDLDEENMLREFYLNVCQKMIESGDWCLQHGTHSPHPYQMMDYIEHSTEQEIVESYFEDIEGGTDGLTIYEYIEDDEFEGFIDYFGNEEIEPKLDVVSTWKLYDGSETLDHDTICEIKTADVNKIGIIVKRMFPTMRYGKIVKAAEWGYHPTYRWSGFMTAMQTKQAWWYINERRQQLAKECKLTLTEASKKVLKESENMKLRVARAMIASYCAGNVFNYYGREYKWKHKPSDKERYAIWAQFRERSA